ncbi:MAG: 6-phosphogluconolactonase [Permianibacter sp.]
MLREFVSADASGIYDAAAEQLAEVIESAVAQRGEALIAVSGGKSPEALFQRLSKLLLPWSRVRLTLVDERVVPLDHADSNARLVQTSLLQGNAAKATWLPLLRSGLTPEQMIEVVQDELRQWPLPFDAVVLGMGDDGHTASWFPDAPELGALLSPDNFALLGIAHPQTAPYTRLTLTRHAVLNSRLIQLLIPGASKQPVYLRAKQQPEPMVELPVRAVLHQSRVPVHVYRTQ